MSAVLERNGRAVSGLRQLLAAGRHGLLGVPDALRLVLRDDAWRSREEPGTGEVVTFDRFADFVAAPPLEGLGADIPMLQRLCATEKDVLDLIDQATTGIQGRHSNNVTMTGNTEQYALRKLRRDAPALHARVLAGDLSAHAAMVEAGFRRPSMTVPTSLPGLARALCRRLSTDDLAALIVALKEQGCRG